MQNILICLLGPESWYKDFVACKCCNERSGLNCTPTPHRNVCVLLFTYFQRDQASANTKAAIPLRSRIKHGLIGPAAIFELLDGWAADEEPALKTIVDIEEPALKTIVDVEESGLEAIVDIEEPNELVEDGVDPATGLA
jgi:hypothetical protein